MSKLVNLKTTQQTHMGVKENKDKLQQDSKSVQTSQQKIK